MIAEQRNKFDISARNLKRARLLYKRIVRSSVMNDESGLILEYCAERMIESGLLSSGPHHNSDLRSARYSILRYCYKHDKEIGLTWRDSWIFWCRKHNWKTWEWVKVLESEAIA